MDIKRQGESVNATMRLRRLGLVPYDILFAIAMIGSTLGLSLPIAYSAFCRLRGMHVGIALAVLGAIGAFILVLSVWTVGCAAIAGVFKMLNLPTFRNTPWGVCVWHVHVRVMLILLFLGILLFVWDLVIHPILRLFVT